MQSDSLADVQDFRELLRSRTGSDHPTTVKARIRFLLRPQPDPQLGDEGYRLTITPAAVDVDANRPAGLFYGSQTLIQLLQPGGRGFPAVSITDWPSMAYRGVMVDISRGLVPNVPTFQRMIRSLARLKINAIQPYIEDTFAFTAYPSIGRDRGAWTPEEVAQLVPVAQQYHVDLSPCFESLGHMGQILKHPEFADLRETGDVITPAKEASYDFLSTCFHELADAFPFPYLNVGCDETGGLGQGPSRAMAEKEGVGKVYSTHLQRLDQLCHQVHRTMQFWGDMMLNYPGIVADMPKDAIVMNWDYGTQQHFTNIDTYKKYGYQQIVCPGIHSWEGMFPNLGAAEGNIRGFIKEGKAAGVLGVLDTAWRDNGEVLFDYDWYPEAISAECSWAGNPTSGDDFDRAFEAAFFGPGSAGLAAAFRDLSQAAFPPGSASGFDLFYADPFHDLAPIGSARGRRSMDHLTDLASQVRQAVQAVPATYHPEVLPYLLLGADRVWFIPEKFRAALQVVDLYNAAVDSADAGTDAGRKDAADKIRQAIDQVSRLHDDTLALRDRYRALWLEENKLPGLQRVLDRYEPQLLSYAALQTRLEHAQQELAAGHPLPSPADMGLQPLAQNEMGYRVPLRMREAPAWAGHAAAALVVNLPAALPRPMPMQVLLHAGVLPTSVPALASLRLLDAQGNAQQTLPCQVDRQPGGDAVLTFFLPANQAGELHLALDPAPAAAAETVSVDPAAEIKVGYWISNSRYRALLGPEGAHLYRWDVLALGGQDITEPGDTEWHGFDDMGAERGTPFVLKPMLSGPLCVQVSCEAPDGFAKTLTFYAGQGWYETRFDSPVDFFWHYDDTRVMGASSATPGSYRFADGRTGPLPKEGDPSVGDAAVWGAKFRPDGLVLGLISPEQQPVLHVGPGGGMGGVGVEGGGSTGHLITLADLAPGGWNAVSTLSDAYALLHRATVSAHGGG